MPTWVLEHELDHPLVDRPAPPDHGEAVVLVRHGGVPLGTVRVSCGDGTLRGAVLRQAIATDLAIGTRLFRRSLQGWLLGKAPSPLPEALDLPAWSVVVCTHERPDDLRRCLAALRQLDAPPGEILVVDNAPTTERTASVVADAMHERSGPHRLRYVREDRPGLNWARMAGGRAATGAVVAYTDDDVVADRQWVRTLLAEFAADPSVAAVTGPALALELQTEAQERFERHGGFQRGWDRTVFDATTLDAVSAGRVGAGANSAFRRDVLLELRLFSHELDAGTVTQSGGDTYAFYLLLAHGRRIVYAPAALVWHRHRRDMAGFARVMRGYSVGGFTMLLRCLVDHGELSALRAAVSWLWWDHVRELGRVVLRRRTALPTLVVREYWRGVLEAPGAWWRSRRRERRLLAEDRAAGVRDFAPADAADAARDAAFDRPAAAPRQAPADRARTAVTDVADERPRPLADVRQ